MTGFYAALAIGPILGAPIQLLYLKSGKRYDIGAVFFIATGAFLGALWGGGGQQQLDSVKAILSLLVPFSLSLVCLRVIALTFFEPMIFTLISLAQMWSVQPLISYALAKNGQFSVYVGQLFPSPIVVAILGGVFNIALAAMLLRLRIPPRLRAVSDSPVEYSILMGSRFRLAVLIEVISLAVYLVTGFAFRVVHGDLSPDAFNGEGLWMLLSIAALPRFDWKLTIIGPLVVVVLRYLVASTCSPDISAIAAYILLALVLAASALYEVRNHRVQRA